MKEEFGEFLRVKPVKPIIDLHVTPSVDKKLDIRKTRAATLLKEIKLMPKSAFSSMCRIHYQELADMMVNGIHTVKEAEHLCWLYDYYELSKHIWKTHPVMGDLRIHKHYIKRDGDRF